MGDATDVLICKARGSAPAASAGAGIIFCGSSLKHPVIQMPSVIAI